MKRKLITMVLILSGLTVKAQEEMLPTGSETLQTYNTERGFIHPGGLHTQADFDRIKQQLAEGNATVTAAYEVLKSAEYAQPSIATYPVETIVRGGGSGENYINAARGATMAYQNALRWKIEDNTACADAAVRILMAWAKTTKYIGGDSNYALAAGLYGYQFAQAAELMRDYEGWDREDFNTFKQWMLSVWYPSAIGFLRGRNGTWENSGKWWQAPGHYWSNWGLCNTLCVISIGILCDDVYIYNQGMSYFKYDQVGTYTDPRTDVPIRNDGLTEFLGNLVVTHVESELETGAYGKLGQMNESGRDTGHSAMALGLAVDIAKVGWNQGDDLFAYMDHRLAAGIEYVAAQTQSVANLPWTNYAYGTNGLYYTDSRVWVMTGPALGAQMRPYWGTVIGIYESIKGVQMPYSDISYTNMGIDAGGSGSTSGGYDHLGYSVLMNTYDTRLAPASSIPTELTGRITYSGSFTDNLIPGLNVEQKLGNIDGQTIRHTELGGLVNSFTSNTQTCVPRGEALTLMPELPDGEEDTGLWEWNTGEKTRNITLTTNRSYVYRVTYTNKNGVKSQQCFPIAVENDCTPTTLTPNITYNGNNFADTDTLDILYGKKAILNIVPSCGWGTYVWSSGQTTQSITSATVLEPTDYTVRYTNQGGNVSSHTFHLNVVMAEPYMVTETDSLTTGRAVIDAETSVSLGLHLPDMVNADEVVWSNGEQGDRIQLEGLQTSETYTASFTVNGQPVTISFDVYVKAEETDGIPTGNYLVLHVESGRLLTGSNKGELATFEPGDIENPTEAQQWYISSNKNMRYRLTCLSDSLHINPTTGKLSVAALYSLYIEELNGADFVAFRTGATSSSIKYWDMATDSTLKTDNTQLTLFPFLLIPLGDSGIHETLFPQKVTDSKTGIIYDLSGRRLNHIDQPGIYLIDGRKTVVK